MFKSPWCVLKAFAAGFRNAFADFARVLVFLRIAIVEAAREYFAPLTGLIAWARGLRWERGRQGTGYDKLLITHGKTWDAWLLRYPEGSFIGEHTDPVDPGLRHYRCNIVLWHANEGGEFQTKVGSPGPTPIINLNRIKVFRPDITTHGVSKIIRGTRYVLSIGWVRKQLTSTSK
jgi:2OG-Fe(II) oxygenase superfamily